MQSSFMGKALLIISVLLSFCLILSAQSRQIDLSTQSSQTLLKNNSDLGFEVSYRIGQLPHKLLLGNIFHHGRSLSDAVL